MRFVLMAAFVVLSSLGLTHWSVQETNAATALITVSGDCISPEEAAFLTLINDYRQANGKNRLAGSRIIAAAAMHHSIDMATDNYFSHNLNDTQPDYNGDGKVTWSENMTAHGYTANAWRGENIAAGMETAQIAFNTFKNSPTHNANMLDDHWTVIGIGRSYYTASSTYKWYWTTDFASIAYANDVPVPCASTPTATVQPSSVQTATPTRTPTPKPTVTKPPSTTVPTLAPTNTAVPTAEPTATMTREQRRCQNDAYARRYPEQCT